MRKLERWVRLDNQRLKGLQEKVEYVLGILDKFSEVRNNGAEHIDNEGNSKFVDSKFKSTDNELSSLA